MRGEKKIRAALPYLTARELWFIECDCHRAADAAAIGGASEARWQQYVTIKNDIAKERKQRFPKSACPFPRACVDGWTDEELIELGEVYNRINRGTFAAPKDLNAGQRPGLVGCASTPPAGGASYSASNKTKEQAL